jgi:8-oxo-dGTP diphosphatase
VAAVLVVDGKVVLVKHGRGDEIYYLLPGGGVERGETLEQAVQREVREETGLECSLGRPLFINDTIPPDGSRHVVNITFHCHVTGGRLTEQALDPRVVGYELVEPGHLPGYDLHPPLGAELAEAATEDFRDPATYLGALWTDGVL